MFFYVCVDLPGDMKIFTICVCYGGYVVLQRLWIWIDEYIVEDSTTWSWSNLQTLGTYASNKEFIWFISANFKRCTTHLVFRSLGS